MNPTQNDPAPLPNDASPETGGSLFRRIGGRDRLLFLLRHFYADVRQHHFIGPIFDRQIQDWPTHLEKIADFWSNVTGGPMRYSGPMPMKHVPLGLDAAHFETWLELWRRHCRAHLGAREADELIAAAEAIGDRIRWVIDRHSGTTGSAAGVSQP